MNKVSSVYIHIPFCNKICTYCDFCKMYYRDDWINEYLGALEKEIKQNYSNELIKTIYIGGGTPSCLNKKQLSRLFEIIKIFNLDLDYELTIECNVEDINNEKLDIFKTNGVNRISIGVQSFNEKILLFLNRNCKKEEIIAKITLTKQYFDNINIDLIYGINFQTIKDLKTDLDNFLKLNIPHISIYGLIKESNTLLDIMKYQELDDDKFYDMYKLIDKKLKDNGYVHYEVSNYAKNGYFSKHNLVYWNNQNYYGFGLGASGYIKNTRYDNTKNLNKYLQGNYLLARHELSKMETMENEMILGLRKIEGVSALSFFEKYNEKLEDVFDVSKLGKKDEFYFIKEENIFIENTILIDFIKDTNMV